MRKQTTQAKKGYCLEPPESFKKVKPRNKPRSDRVLFTDTYHIYSDSCILERNSCKVTFSLISQGTENSIYRAMETVGV